MIDDGFGVGRVFDDVELTLEERVSLAEMAAGCEDPWLAGQLLGTVKPPPPRRSFELHTSWVAIGLLMTGAAFSLATFAHWVWAAVLGVVLMGGGAALMILPWIREKGEPPLVRPISERGQWAPRGSKKPAR